MDINNLEEQKQDKLLEFDVPQSFTTNCRNQSHNVNGEKKKSET